MNLLEVCGILSFDQNERQLRGLYRHFGRRFGVRIVHEDREGRAVMPATPSEVLTLMAAQMRLGDALVAALWRGGPPRPSAS